MCADLVRGVPTGSSVQRIETLAQPCCWLPPSQSWPWWCGGQYGVPWIFADQRDGPVSPRLDELAVLRHDESRVKIYELPAEHS